MEVEGNRMHQRAKFSCVEGYFLEGFDDIVCTPSGYWSHDPPPCKAIKCPIIKTDDPYLRITHYNRTYGSRVFFSCPNGYKLNGVSFATCLKNNSWDETVPFCE
ncbi:Locomotion-related protein Hikaru genki-like protein, partial [Dinothrombium tinctorium]